jgi:hypothetical protein
MMGWAGIALAELKSGVPAAEQFGSDIGGVLLLSVTLTLASLFPKFVSGSSLKVCASKLMRIWEGRHLGGGTCSLKF